MSQLTLLRTGSAERTKNLLKLRKAEDAVAVKVEQLEQRLQLVEEALVKAEILVRWIHDVLNNLLFVLGNKIIQTPSTVRYLSVGFCVGIFFFRSASVDSASLGCANFSFLVGKVVV